MKYILTESKYHSLIKKQIDKMFSVEDIHWTHPYEYDEEGNEYEDSNAIEFYYNDYGDDETVFRWYDKNYWGEGSVSFYAYRENSPLIEVENQFSTTLNGLFGDKWYEPFKEWFRENFNMEVKSITDEIYNKRKSS
jgi:hypothetical protein